MTTRQFGLKVLSERRLIAFIAWLDVYYRCLELVKSRHGLAGIGVKVLRGNVRKTVWVYFGRVHWVVRRLRWR
jgi:hypothetical protein